MDIFLVSSGLSLFPYFVFSSSSRVSYLGAFVLYFFLSPEVMDLVSLWILRALIDIFMADVVLKKVLWIRYEKFVVLELLVVMGTTGIHDYVQDIVGIVRGQN